MRKLKLMMLAVVAGFCFQTANAQLIDEQDVTITMELQPVLQLDMKTPNQLEFVFDEIEEYYRGITQYAATELKVSSSVSWDLYAVGRSNGTNCAECWDQQLVYGSGGVTSGAQANLPMSLVELRQNRANSGAGVATSFPDYNQAFSPAATASGGNSLYVNGGTNTPPGVNGKYIAGHSGTSGTPGTDAMVGGSWMTQTGTASDYYYTVDYRILPGLPAIFPMAFNEDGVTAEDLSTVSATAYAQPGVYTMYVQYVLLEDQ
ncbi:MAG: hypothetical protein AAF487_00660 [Bacteroidota bacterium]